MILIKTIQCNHRGILSIFSPKKYVQTKGIKFIWERVIHGNIDCIKWDKCLMRTWEDKKKVNLNHTTIQNRWD